MSLIKQLWIAIGLVTLLAFGGSLIISTLSARAYLSDQLRVMNADSASALALTLTQMPKDPVTVELLVSAQFDTGHYREITITAPDGSNVIRRASDVEIREVPAWFMQLVPISEAAGIAQVQDGWHQFGSLTVRSDPRYAYESLWRGTLMLLLWFASGAVLSGLLGTVLLKRILHPLDRVIEQAQAIGGRRFVTNDEPRTTEFRSLVRAMNTLSARVRDMLAEEAARLEELRRRNQHDALTGTLNREHFLKVLDTALGDPNRAGMGSIAVIRSCDLEELNRRVGHARTDRLLCDIAGRLKGIAEQTPGYESGRLNGSDFVLLAPGLENPRHLAEQLETAFAPIAAAWPEQAPDAPLQLLIGTTDFAPHEARGEVLGRMDGALASAEQNREPPLTVATQTSNNAVSGLADMNAWRSALDRALAEERARFDFYPVASCEGELLHQEAPLRLELNGRWYGAGSFMPWAERLQLTTRIDRIAISIALRHIESSNQPTGVNLSASSLSSPDFIHSLCEILQAHAEAATRLWIELPEHGVVRDIDRFRLLCNALKPFGCRIGIEHAGRQFSRLGGLHDIGLDYIKIDTAFIHGIAKDSGNASFVHGLCVLAHSIGLQVIAEGVDNAEDRQRLCELGIDGLTGPAIRLP